MDIIDVLERIGQDAVLRNASRDELEIAFADEGGPRTAFLGQDNLQIADPLGVAIVCSAQFPGPEEEEEDEGEGEEAPPREE